MQDYTKCIIAGDEGELAFADTGVGMSFKHDNLYTGKGTTVLLFFLLCKR